MCTSARSFPHPRLRKRPPSSASFPYISAKSRCVQPASSADQTSSLDRPPVPNTRAGMATPVGRRNKATLSHHIKGAAVLKSICFGFCVTGRGDEAPVELPPWWASNAARWTSSSNEATQLSTPPEPAWPEPCFSGPQKRSASARMTAPAAARAAAHGGTKVSTAPVARRSVVTTIVGSSSARSKSNKPSRRFAVPLSRTWSRTALGNCAPGRTKRGTY
mmetsp:Transcript_11202/g.26304  ORF Transcript_11202/g.26304 Transcript_11202/m.26304 type:complete len:219 (+) Transcript_11202:984-1640(+)